MTVIGHSLGGGVAMQLAYQHPELVDRLVLIGSGGLGREVSWLLRLLTLPGAEYLMPLFFPPFVRDGGNELGKAIHERGWSLPHVGEMWRAYASLGQAENRKAFVRTLRAVIDPGGQTVNATDRLYLAAAMPTLIIWGDKDGIIPVEHAYAAHEAIPHSRLEILEGCGHFPHVQEPAQLVEVIRDFVLTDRAAPRWPATVPGSIDRSLSRPRPSWRSLFRTVDAARPTSKPKRLAPKRHSRRIFGIRRRKSAGALFGESSVGSIDRTESGHGTVPSTSWQPE